MRPRDFVASIFIDFYRFSYEFEDANADADRLGGDANADDTKKRKLDEMKETRETVGL